MTNNQQGLREEFNEFWSKFAKEGTCAYPSYSEIADWFISHFSQTIDRVVEEIEEKYEKVPLLFSGGIMGLGNNFKEHEEKLKHNKILSLAIQILLKAKKELE